MPFFHKKFEKIYFCKKRGRFWAFFVPFNCNHTWISRFLYHFSKKLKFFIPTSRIFQKSFSNAFNNKVEILTQNLILFLKISQKIFALVKSKEKAAIAAWRSRFDSGLSIYCWKRKRWAEAHRQYQMFAEFTELFSVRRRTGRQQLTSSLSELLIEISSTVVAANIST